MSSAGSRTATRDEPSEGSVPLLMFASGPVRAYLLLCTTTLCWGANTIFAKLAVGEVSPMMLTAWRWLGVVLLVWMLAYRRVIRDWDLLRPHLVYLLLMGIFGFSGFNGLFYAAAHQTTALNLGIIQGTVPVFVIIGAFIVFRDRVTLLQCLGIFVTLIGVLFVVTEGDVTRLQQLTFNAGDLMIILACALYAGYTIWLREKPAVSALTWFAMLATAAFIASVPMAIVEWQLGFGQYPTPTAWGLLVLIILLPSFLAQICFIRGVELLGPGRAGVFVNLVPILSSIAAVFVLGEAFEWFHAVALVLVIAGIGVAERFAIRA
ncbi:MAG: DMT family transporter [Pseudomonadota bacterium]